jgi:hypothetical protein
MHRMPRQFLLTPRLFERLSKRFTFFRQYRERKLRAGCGLQVIELVRSAKPNRITSNFITLFDLQPGNASARAANVAIKPKKINPDVFIHFLGVSIFNYHLSIKFHTCLQQHVYAETEKSGLQEENCLRVFSATAAAVSDQ